MSSALMPGRPIRYRVGEPTSKIPEMAGIYYIYDADGSEYYAGKSFNMRARIRVHIRNGKIPEGGYVDCIRAKEGITWEELDKAEREKIAKHHPPANKSHGGEGRIPNVFRTGKGTGQISDTYGGSVSAEEPSVTLETVLGYEKVVNGEVHYTKEPRAKIWLIGELVGKITLICTFILSAVFAVLFFGYGLSYSLLIYEAAAITAAFLLVFFKTVRSNWIFAIIGLASLLLNAFITISLFGGFRWL